MNQLKKMSRHKFIRICVEEGLPKDIAQDLYIHFKTRKKIVLANLPSTEEWVRKCARQSAHNRGNTNN